MPNREAKLAKLKKGPGVFTYTGDCVDHECTPVPKMRTSKVPKLDAEGHATVNSQGYPIYEKAGSIILDDSGRAVLGGEPKVKTSKLATVNLWGVDFAKGEKVTVDDDGLALKLRGLSYFQEIDPEAPKPRGRPKKNPDAE